MTNYYEMKKHFFEHKKELNELNRAINSGNKILVKKLIEDHYVHLRIIYKLCNS